jgi:hypothetical protein
MAGLLDIFGTSGADTMGLLGMSQGDISRNRDDAQAQALYALAGRLFQGGNTGASIAQGLQQGQQAYKQAMQGNVQEQLQNVQLMDMIRKRKQEQATLAEQQRVQGVIQGAVTKPQEIYGEDMMGQRVGEGMTAPSFDLQRAMPQLISSPEGRKTLGELIAAQKAMGGETTSLAEGAKLVRTNPITGMVEVIAEGAPKEKASPAEIQGYNLAKEQGYKGSFLDYQTSLKRAGATSINLPSEGERKAATLASRLNFSVGQMNEAIGLDPKAAMPNTTAEIARFVSRTEFLPNKLNTEQRQIVEAAQEDILDAALTLGTGAAYSREQLAGYKKSYFPQLGDGPDQVKSKQARLNNLLKSAEVASGRAAGQITAPIPKLPQEQDSGLPAGVTVKKKG